MVAAPPNSPTTHAQSIMEDLLVDVVDVEEVKGRVSGFSFFSRLPNNSGIAEVKVAKMLDRIRKAKIESSIDPTSTRAERSVM